MDSLVELRRSLGQGGLTLGRLHRTTLLSGLRAHIPQVATLRKVDWHVLVFMEHT